MNINVYIGGHAFEVDYGYTPEIKENWGPAGGEEHKDESLEISSIYLGDQGQGEEYGDPNDPRGQRKVGTSSCPSFLKSKPYSAA